jgi:hypothetical protein
MAAGVETKVTLSPGPVQVPGEPDGVEDVAIQIWIRSSEGSWSGLLSREQAERLGRELVAAAERAGGA